MPEKKKQEDINDVVIEESEEGLKLSKTDPVKKLKEQLKKCLKERQEFLDGWQRAKADSINLKKEEERKREKVAEFTKEDMINQFLPVLDSFELAFSNEEAWERVDKNWRSGVECIYSQLVGILKENGLSEINPSGETFDPRYHSSAETAETSDKKKDGKISTVLQKGYNIKDTVIRPARVIVFEYKEKL